jgi:hypothetical protein
MSLTARRALGVAALASALLALGSSAAVADSSSSCVTPTLTQPFTAWGDQNWYTLVPGQSPDNFDGAGWSLGGGATLTAVGLADGSTGSVLDLPSGAWAVSPQVCVDSSYTSARTMIREPSGSDGLAMSVQYQGGPPLSPVGVAGGSKKWNASAPISLQPTNNSGWVMARFKFWANGSGNDEYQLYNFYVDPYSKG